MCTNFGLSNLVVILAKESKLAAPGTKKSGGQTQFQLGWMSSGN
jgi:hypothetical protein